MGIPIVSAIVDGVGKVLGLVDDLHTSEEEKLTVKATLLGVYASVVGQVVEYETKIAEAKRDIIVAEAQSDSWITRSWRPILMLLFGGMTAYAFVTGHPLPEDLWTVIKIGLGGYIGGRSLEKVVPGVVGALKSQEG